MGFLKFFPFVVSVLFLIPTAGSFSNQNKTLQCEEIFKSCKGICENKYLRGENKTAAYKGCLFRCELDLKTCEAKKVWEKAKPELEKKYKTFKEWFEGFLQK